MKLPHYAIGLVLLACSILARSFQSPLMDDTDCNNNPSPDQITVQRNLIRNPVVGGSGGQPFTAVAPPNAYVRTIELWCGPYVENIYIIHGIRLVYTDGTASNLYGSKTTDPRSHTFDPQERVNYINIKATDRTDAIQLYTTISILDACGTGGSSHIQNPGDGRLVGFAGRAAKNVDALGSIFEVSFLSSD